jgi:hypothetical protein
VPAKRPRVPLVSVPHPPEPLVVGALGERPEDRLMSQWDGYAGAQQAVDHWRKGAKVEEPVPGLHGATETITRKLCPRDLRYIPDGRRGTRWAP